MATFANSSADPGRCAILCDQRLENAGDFFENVAGRAIAANLVVVSVLVMSQHGTRQLIVCANPLFDDIFLIVLAGGQLRAVVIADSCFLRRLMEQVVNSPAFGALAA